MIQFFRSFSWLHFSTLANMSAVLSHISGTCFTYGCSFQLLNQGALFQLIGNISTCGYYLNPFHGVLFQPGTHLCNYEHYFSSMNSQLATLRLIMMGLHPSWDTDNAIWWLSRSVRFRPLPRGHHQWTFLRNFPGTAMTHSDLWSFEDRFSRHCNHLWLLSPNCRWVGLNSSRSHYELLSS